MTVTVTATLTDPAAVPLGPLRLSFLLGAIVDGRWTPLPVAMPAADVLVSTAATTDVDADGVMTPVELIAVDDPDLSVSGLTYRVDGIPGARPRYVEILTAHAPTVDLADLADAVTGEPVISYALAAAALRWRRTR